MRKYLTSSEFRKNPSKDALVRKAGLLVNPELTSPRCLRFVISNEQTDRSGDIIKLDGWKLENFYLNPVVLFEHNADAPPVGRCVQIAVINDRLEATVEFVPASVPWAGDRADGVMQLCQAGFLSACSVGFRVIDYEKSETGNIFLEQELVEFSIVTIPDNPAALIIDDRKAFNPALQRQQRDRLLTIIGLS